MFDEAFCGHLEYAITDALTKAEDIDWRRCWCDGVLLPTTEIDYSQKQILKTKEVVAKAWIDEGKIKGTKRGQFLYDMKIQFGLKSLDNVKAGARLEECIPNTGADAWILLDRKNKTIVVQLM